MGGLDIIKTLKGWGIKANNEWKTFNGYKIPFLEYKFIKEINSILAINDDDWKEGINPSMDEYAGFVISDNHFVGLQIERYYRLTSLPNNIRNLENLKSLILNNNSLNELPESIGELGNLQVLSLNYNRLTRLPESIGELGNLRELNLVDNQLTELPESIGKLGNLWKLNLNHNQLTELPESLMELKNMQYLFLRQNNLEDIPPWLEDLKKKGIAYFK